MPSIVMSPPVTAAIPMKLPTSMCSGPIECAPPERRSTPVMCSTFEPIPSISRAERDEEPAEILDVRLAGGVRDHRLARRERRGHDGVLGRHHGRLVEVDVRRRQGAGRARSGRSSRMSPRAPANAWMCGSSRRRPITSPPGGGTTGAAVAREQRAGEQERRADPARELRVDLVADVGGVDAHLVLADPLDVGAEVREQLRASSRRRGCAGRSRA